MDATCASLLGVVIGAVLGYITNQVGIIKANELAKNREIEKNKSIILNELTYSSEIFEKSYNLTIDSAENISINIIKIGTLIIDSNCKDSIKYLRLDANEKKKVIEWITCLEESEDILRNECNLRKLAGHSLWREKGRTIGEDMNALLPDIKNVILKLEDC